MKDKKGFTLVELLAVIVILGLIAVIAAPLVLGTINSSKDSLSKEQQNRVIEAAKIYATKQLSEDSACVSISELQSGGYLETDVVDPKSGSNMANSKVQIVWCEDINQYGYKYDATGACSYSKTQVCSK